MLQTGERNSVNNRILLALSAESFARIRPLLERVPLEQHKIILDALARVEFTYFVNRGLISLVKVMQDGRVVEIGAVGVEGLTDPVALFGMNKAALDTMVQIPGDAYRIKLNILKDLIASDEQIRTILQNYARFTIRQLAQTAACNRLHTLEERCARWLLIAHDSALNDTFPLTHEFLAMMLGSRRSGVSIAAHTLKKAGLIDYARGVVTIVDRGGLEETACECYGTIQAEVDELLPVHGPRQASFAK